MLAGEVYRFDFEAVPQADGEWLEANYSHVLREAGGGGRPLSVGPREALQALQASVRRLVVRRLTELGDLALAERLCARDSALLMADVQAGQSLLVWLEERTEAQHYARFLALE